MEKINKETSINFKKVNSRYIVIRENIYEALDLHTLAVYMAFRYEADYEKEDAIVARSARVIYEKAKVSRRQFFISLNILESFGLVLRDSKNQVNTVSTYHVAQELYYFNTDCGVVHDMHGVVHGMHTYHYSFPLYEDKKNSDLDENSKQVNQEIVDVYHEELPECPKIKVIDSKLIRQFNHMRKNWPKYQKDGLKFTLESFRNYLKYIKQNYSWFVKPYTTSNGNVRCNNLRVLTKEINIVKIVNGEFSVSY